MHISVAGSDTVGPSEPIPNYDTDMAQTASLLRSFILAMAHFPDVQAKAQAEIDALTRGTRLPDFSDRPSLPYVAAMLSEALRWGTAAPLSVPHRSLKEDEYEGFRIPAGRCFQSI